MSSDTPAAESRRAIIKIGKYEILKLIATGGMGAVYRARDTQDDREVALKVLTPDMAAKPAMLERFRREAEHAKKLSHENIVTIFEFGDSNGTFFLAMEFVEGIDLHEYISKKKSLDPEESRQIMLQATRALDHAHRCGIVHRDIKPSNFLLTKRKGKLLVKMTDMGLARNPKEEDSRLTRDGTTVGTVDYISPEQARDSGKADIRSDLYSLGCTWFHMLTGRPPFPEGGLAEKLCKHMLDEPPNVRRSDPRISRELAAIVDKLLAKKPEDRYQNPAELVVALQSLKAVAEPGKDTDTISAEEIEEASSPASSSSSERDTVAVEKQPTRAAPNKRYVGTRRTTPPAKRPAPEEKKEEPDLKKTPGKLNLAYVLGGGLGLMVLIVLVIALSSGGPRKRPNPTEGEQASVTPPVVQPNPIVTPVEPPPKENPNPIKNGQGTHELKTHEPPRKFQYKALYHPEKLPDLKKLAEEIEKPWTSRPIQVPPPNTPVLRVARVADGQPGNTYSSLAAAIAAAPKEGAVIEVCDNGPLYETALSVTDKPLIIRAAAGYRPLVVWDLKRVLEEPNREKIKPSSYAFLSMQKGSLTLEGVEIVLQMLDQAPDVPFLFLHAQEGDLSVRGCTFSVAYKGIKRLPVTLAQLVGQRLDREPMRCRISGCYARANTLVAVDMQTVPAEVLIEDTLIVGGKPTLLQVKTADDKDQAVNVRVVRSTLIGSGNLLQTTPVRASEQMPSFSFLGWDALLSRSSQEAGGELLSMPAGVNTTRTKWEAINCYYTGWQHLLAATPKFADRADSQEWRVLGPRHEAEVSERDPWPPQPYQDLEDKPASEFKTQERPVCFARSDNPEKLLGCEWERLPATRDDWLKFTQERFVLSPPEPPDPNAPPPEPVENTPDAYNGEILTLQANVEFDLGKFLRDKLERFKFGPKVVIRLRGAGGTRHFISPVKLPRGTSLVLHVDPPEEPKVEPKTPGSPMTPTGTKPPLPAKPIVLAVRFQELKSDQEKEGIPALLELEEGNLEMTNVEFQLPNDPYAEYVPQWVLKVNGNLQLFRCRLFGPQTKDPRFYRGLIYFRGSQEMGPEKEARVCNISESVLLSNKEGIHLEGTGIRLLLEQTLLVSATDALILDLSEDYKGRANVQGTLRRCTLAAWRSVVSLRKPKDRALAVEPIILQTQECAFLNPFPATKTVYHPAPSRAVDTQAGILLSEGTALAQGLFVWQPLDDVLDPRFSFAAASDQAISKQDSVTSSWERLWAFVAKKPQKQPDFKKTFDTNPNASWTPDPQTGRGMLDRLTVPGTRTPMHPNPINKKVGADLEKLGILKKPTKPM